VTKAAKGASFDPSAPGLVSFAGGTKKPSRNRDTAWDTDSQVVRRGHAVCPGVLTGVNYIRASSLTSPFECPLARCMCLVERVLDYGNVGNGV
jgi:hypothetical protein